MKLCACLAEQNIKNCLGVAKYLDTPLVEHRIDYLDDARKLETFYSSLKQSVIATNRPAWEGGRFTGSEADRINILKNAIGAGAYGIDVELDTNGELRASILDDARDHDVASIVSKHYFSGTPSERILQNTLHNLQKSGANMGKLVTTANSPDDCHTILGMMIEAKKMDFPLIAFAMGEVGAITRVASLYYGSPFMYVAARGKTAPGQLNVEDMKIVLKRLGN